MLDKHVVKFTRDGIQRQNLSTGENEMLTHSAFSHEVKYNPLQGQTFRNHPLETESLTDEQQYIRSHIVSSHSNTARIEFPTEPHADSDALSHAAEKFTDVPVIFSKDVKTDSRNSVPDQFHRERFNEKSSSPIGSTPGSQSSKNTKYIKNNISKNRMKKLNMLKKMKGAASSEVNQQMNESDNLGLQTVGESIKLAGNTKNAIRDMNDLRKRISPGSDMAKKSLLKKAFQKTRNQAAYRSFFKNKTAQAGNTALRSIRRRIRQAIMKAMPKKYIVAAAAVIVLLLLLMQMCSSGVTAIVGGGTVGNTEVKNYAQQLDDDLKKEIEAKKAEYEKQPDTDVKVIGEEMIDTDGNILALLVTTQWTILDLNDSNKQLMKSRHRALNTYEITEKDETVSTSPASGNSSSTSSGTSSGASSEGSTTKTIRHITISVRVYTPEDIIDSFGFTDEQKKNVLETLPIIRELDGDTSGGGGEIIFTGKGIFAWPVPGYTYISSYFGETDGRSKPHPGMDIAGANIYGKPIVAAADGTVIWTTSGWGGGYGNAVCIDHGDGITSRYGHMSKVAATTGEQVKKGQIIGYVGSTGDSTGPHCHFEVRKNDTPVNPLPLLTDWKKK